MATAPNCPTHQCRPNTKPSCKTCIKTKVDAAALYRAQGGILPTKLADWPILRFMGAHYLRVEGDEEEHY